MNMLYCGSRQEVRIVHAQNGSGPEEGQLGTSTMYSRWNLLFPAAVKSIKQHEI